MYQPCKNDGPNKVNTSGVTASKGYLIQQNTGQVNLFELDSNFPMCGLFSNKFYSRSSDLFMFWLKIGWNHTISLLVFKYQSI